MTEEFETVQWYQVDGSRYNRAPTNRMLEPQGDKYFSFVPLVGSSKQKKHKVWVHYDRNYVVNFLAKRAISKLQPIDRDSFFQLIGEAWDAWENNQQDNLGSSPCTL